MLEFLFGNLTGLILLESTCTLMVAACFISTPRPKARKNFF